MKSDDGDLSSVIAPENEIQSEQIWRKGCIDALYTGPSIIAGKRFEVHSKLIATIARSYAQTTGSEACGNKTRFGSCQASSRVDQVCYMLLSNA